MVHPQVSRLSAFAWCSTTCRPIPPARSTRLSQPTKRDGAAPAGVPLRPQHASWLNMVEIEIGVLASQCLDRRIESYTRLVAETAAWEKRRNAECARINWMFTTQKPAPKWGALTPSPRSNQTKIKRKPLCRGTSASANKEPKSMGRRNQPLGDLPLVWRRPGSTAMGRETERETIRAHLKRVHPPPEWG